MSEAWQVVEGCDGVQGKGASAHSATHRFITSVLGDLGAKGMPRDCHDGPLVGRRARAGVG